MNRKEAMMNKKQSFREMTGLVEERRVLAWER